MEKLLTKGYRRCPCCLLRLAINHKKLSFTAQTGQAPVCSRRVARTRGDIGRDMGAMMRKWCVAGVSLLAVAFAGGALGAGERNGKGGEARPAPLPHPNPRITH